MSTMDKTAAQVLNLVYDEPTKTLNVTGMSVELDSESTQGDLANDTTIQTSHEAKDFDGSALPNTVDEGDAVRPAASLSGVAYTMPVNEDGSKSPVNPSGYFDVEIQADNSGIAKESGGNLDTIAGDTTSIDGKITACNTGAVVVASGAITETNSGDIKTAVEKIDDLQGALKSVDTDEIVTRVTDSTGTEINPAEEDGNLATVANDTTAISDVSGTTADAANTTGTTGTISGKLRGLVKILADVWDSVSNVLKVQEQSPLQEQYTDPVQLVSSAQDLTASFATLESAISGIGGYKYMRVPILLDGNDSRDVQIRVVYEIFSGGALEIPYDPQKWTIRYSTLSTDQTYRTLDGTASAELDGWFSIEIELDNCPPAEIKIQAKAGTVGATAGQIDNAYVIKGY